MLITLRCFLRLRYMLPPFAAEMFSFSFHAATSLPPLTLMLYAMLPPSLLPLYFRCFADADVIDFCLLSLRYRHAFAMPTLIAI